MTWQGILKLEQHEKINQNVIFNSLRLNSLNQIRFLSQKYSESLQHFFNMVN